MNNIKWKTRFEEVKDQDIGGKCDLQERKIQRRLQNNKSYRNILF